MASDAGVAHFSVDCSEQKYGFVVEQFETVGFKLNASRVERKVELRDQS